MLFRVFPGQQLEEDDLSAAPKMRWPIFPKWGWTPDKTSKLEAQDIKVVVPAPERLKTGSATRLRRDCDLQLDRKYLCRWCSSGHMSLRCVSMLPGGQAT